MKLASILIVAAALAAAIPSAFAADRSETLVHDGVARSYLLHIPDRLPPGKHALVLVFHGGGGNGVNAARVSGMSAVADRRGFIVAYPNGSGRGGRILTWNVGNCCGYALDHHVDDVGFVRALIDKLTAELPVDPNRVYATGISNGGMLSYRVGCELADKVAAIAPVAGALDGECHPSAPVSVAAFHGTEDQHVLFEGGPSISRADTHSRTDRPVRETVAFWAEHDHCSRKKTDTIASGVTLETWGGCVDGTEVSLYVLQGFGHAWPGGKRGSPWGDNPAAAISASEAMWTFFREHPKE